MQELGPLAMGTVDHEADSRDVLVSWSVMRRSFQCCVWAWGLWDRLHPMPGEHDTITVCLTLTPPICSFWRAKGMALWVWVNAQSPALGQDSSSKGPCPSTQLRVGGRTGGMLACWANPVRLHTVKVPVELMRPLRLVCCCGPEIL